MFAAPSGVPAPDIFRCGGDEVKGRNLAECPGYVAKTVKQILKDHGLSVPPASTTSSQSKCEKWVSAEITGLSGTFDRDRVGHVFQSVQEEQVLIFLQRARQAECTPEAVQPPQGVAVQTMEIDAPVAPVPIDVADVAT